MLRQWDGKPSISRCFDHSAGKSVRRAMPMPYGSRPSKGASIRFSQRRLRFPCLACSFSECGMFKVAAA
jgi:hypothetical protein